MLVSKRIAEYSKRSSWIRKMFEEGARLKSIHGPENVYDFSLGNPDLEPPRVAIDYMAEVAKDINTPHGYMPNAGYMDVRERIAEFATQIQEVDLRAEDIIMSCGAGGGLNVVLKAITDPGDEIIAIAPYFVEYRFYVENHGGTLVCSESNSELLPDAEDLGKNITPRTKAIIINSPNNPTGRVYSETTLLEIKNVLASHPDIVVISDEPYRRLVYDGLKVPPILRIFPNSIVVTSASKELSLAGERIGYIAVGPGVRDKNDLIEGLILSTRILGFVNAPALMQRVLAHCIDISVDIGVYKRRRDLLVSILDETGLEYAPPEGAFYLFVKSPVPDDLEFTKALQKERILAVPGTGFGRKGSVRFAYCTAEETIARAKEGIKKASLSLNKKF